MKREDDSSDALRARVRRPEEGFAALLAQRDERSTGPEAPATQQRSEDRATAMQALHRDALRLLGSLAQDERARLIFVATADEQSASAGGPDSVRQLAIEPLVQPLAALGVAIGHPTRAKILRTLLLQGECYLSELIDISGTSGGNLYQHLDAIQGANLLYQPGRGRYRLTEDGGRVAAVLFRCAPQVRAHAQRLGR